MLPIPVPDTDAAHRRVMESQEYHLKPTSDVRMGNDGMMYRTHIMLRGSSTYDTAEIASPEERRILKEKYGIGF